MPVKINAAFWKWFGDSVVKNDDGTPMVVYHGTSDKFDAFDTDGSHIGSHFSSSLGPASYYSGRKRKGGRLIAAYLRIEHPWVSRDLGRWGEDDVAKEWVRQQGQDPKDIDAWHPVLMEIRSFGPNFSRAHENCTIKAWLKSKGYDGIYYLNRYESGSGDKSASSWSDRAMSHALSDEEFQRKFPEASWDWIAFYPWQIKSLKNDGTWDLDDPRYGSNPFGDRRILSRQEAEAYVAAGLIPVTRTEGYTPILFAEDAIAKQKGPWDWHGMYYFVGEDGDKVLPLGKTFIFNNKVDAMIQLGYSREKVASKLHYYFDGHHKDGVTIDEFLEPYISGKVSRWYGDWADSFIAQQAKRNGADNVILLREPNAEHGYNTGTEVVDLQPVKTHHWSEVDLHEMFAQNPSDGLCESRNPDVEDRGPEKFRFLLGVFDVQKAKQILIAKPRKPVTFDIKDISKWFGAVKIDKARAMSDEVDVNMPVIGVFLGEGKEKGFFPIDGWHRMYKAHQLGMEEMPMLLLNKRESKSVIIGYHNPDDGLGEA